MRDLWDEVVDFGERREDTEFFSMSLGVWIFYPSYVYLLDCFYAFFINLESYLLREFSSDLF